MSITSLSDAFKRLDLHFPALGSCSHEEKSDLMTAVEKGDAKKTRRLLNTKATCLLCCTADGNSVMHLAAASGHALCIRLLAGKGAPLHTKNRDNYTPLKVAARGAQTAAIKAFTETRGFSDYSDALESIGNSQTAKEANLSCFEALLDAQKCLFTDTAWADKLLVSYSQRPDREYFIEPLLRAGANPNAKDCYGNTVLERAASHSMETAVNLLVARGARGDNDRGFKTSLPTNLATFPTIVETLLEVGFYVNHEFIMEVVDRGQENLAKLLRERGVVSRGLVSSLHIMRNNWRSIRTAFLLGGIFHKEDFEKFLARGAPMDVITLGLSNGVDLENDGFELLRIAIQHDRLDVIMHLSDLGADLKRYGYALIAAAAKYNRAKIMRYLFDKGVEMQDKGGFIPALKAAVRHVHTEALDILLEMGAIYNMVPQGSDNEFMTALELFTTDMAKHVLSKSKKTETIEHTGAYGMRPIEKALVLARECHVRLLINEGVNLDRPFYIQGDQYPQADIFVRKKMSVRAVVANLYPDLLEPA